MNAKIRTLVLAAPLATAALALGAGPALAGPVGDGPGTIIAPGHIDPEPPGPQIPGDKVGVPDDGPDNPHIPPGPGDLDSNQCPTHGGGPQCEGDPDRPDDLTSHPGDPGDDTPGDDTPGDDTPGGDPGDEVNGFDVPTRIDTGAGGSTEGDGVEIAWILAGGALITVSGAAFAGRRMSRDRA